MKTKYFIILAALVILISLTGGWMPIIEGIVEGLYFVVALGVLIVISIVLMMIFKKK